MTLVAALLPFTVVLVLLLLRRTTLETAIAGLAAVVIAIAWRFPLSWQALAHGSQHWWGLLAEVVSILFGGLWLNRLLETIGAHRAIAEMIAGRAGSGLPAVLLVTHGIAPFAEGITGFGVGALIAIPLLRHLGQSPRNAAVLGLMGLIAVPWGSMGPGTLIAAQMSGVDFTELGVLSAALSIIPFVVVGSAAVLITRDPESSRVRGFLAACAVSVVLWLPILGVNLLVATPPAGALGALVAIGVQLAALRRGRAGASAPAVPARRLLPYLVLLGGILVTSLLQRLVPSVDTPSLEWLGSPALWLFIACVAAMLAFPGERPAFRSAFTGAVRAWRTVGPATGLFVVIGILLSLSGIAAFLARGLVPLGPVYVLVAPALGGLAGLLTGSNSGANAMLAGTQSATALLVGSPHAGTIAAHNVSTSLATMANPARVELAAGISAGSSGERIPRSTIYAPLLTVNAVNVALLGLVLFVWQAVT